MVHFGTKLHTNKISKWSDEYVDYDGLKKLAKKVAKQLEEIRGRSVNLSAGPPPQLASPRSFRWGSSVKGSIPEASPLLQGIRRPRSMSRGSKSNPNSNDKNAVGSNNLAEMSLDLNENISDEDSKRRMRSHRRALTIGEQTNLLSRSRGNSEYGAVLTPRSRSNSYFDAFEDWSDFESMDESLINATMHLEMLRVENPDQAFVDKVKEEAEKVNMFYKSKMEEFNKRFAALIVKMQSLRRVHMSVDPDIEEEDAVLPRDVWSADSVKAAFREMYREMNFLQSYAILNYTAFVKILKKHDKVTGLRINKSMMKILHQRYKSQFIDFCELTKLMERVEQVFSDTFFHGNSVVAKSELLLRQEAIDDWEMLHIGLRVGMVFILFLWVIWDVAIDAWMKPDEPQLPEAITRIFRGFGMFILGMWMWAGCVFIWRAERVHYIYLFEFDQRRTFSPEELFSKASTATLVHLSLLLLYMKISRGEIYGMPPEAAKWIPLALLIYMTQLLFIPIDKNASLLNALLRVVFSPWQKVTFFFSFVGDVLTSLTKPLVDLAFTLCFFFSGDWHRLYDSDLSAEDRLKEDACTHSFVFDGIFTPIIIASPLIFRILQNLRRFYDTKKRVPHIANATKYSLSCVLILLGALHPTLATVTTKTPWYKMIWVMAFVSSTLFTFYWDVKWDWGLLRPGSRGLRELLMFPSRNFYYAVIAADLFLRFSWCFTLIPQTSVIFEHGTHSYTVVVLSSFEICRRAMWSLVRVEYEHNYNDLDYRRVRFVPLDFRSSLEKGQRTGTTRNTVIFELASFVAVVILFCVAAVETGDYQHPKQ